MKKQKDPLKILLNKGYKGAPLNSYKEQRFNVALNMVMKKASLEQDGALYTASIY